MINNFLKDVKSKMMTYKYKRKEYIWLNFMHFCKKFMQNDRVDFSEKMTEVWAVGKASLHMEIITTYGFEPGWSIHDQDEVWVKLSGGSNWLMLKN